MEWWKHLLWRLLYLTPVGYLFDSLELISGKAVRGIYVQMGDRLPFCVLKKNDPTTKERLGWLGNGIVLLVQGIIVGYRNIGGDWGSVYALLALIYGSVSIFSVVFPGLDWNKKLF